MKKILWTLFSLCLIFCFFSCASSPKEQEVEIQTKKELNADRIFAFNHPTKTVWSSIEPQEFVTSKNWENAPGFDMHELDLSGYIYVDMELSSPNSGDYLVRFDGFSWADDTTENILYFSAHLTKEPQVFRIPIPKYYEDWSSGERVIKPVTRTTLNRIQFNACDTDNNWEWVEGVKIYLKSIVLTNTPLQRNDGFIFYESQDTSGKEIDFFNTLILGDVNLEGYTFLNIEAYCPDAGDNLVQFYGNGGNENVCYLEIQPVPQGFRTYQMLFGTNNITWTDWSTGSAVEKKSTSNQLEYIYFALFDTSDPSKGWQNVNNGSHIYIKRVYATNILME